jgi:hypothetical protein
VGHFRESKVLVRISSVSSFSLIITSLIYRCRVATRQRGQVALEAGSSPSMIFKHYRELVQPKEAKAWFAIIPKH